MSTRQANYLAYKSLGIKPPPDFHVRPWQEWCSKEAHDTKGLIVHQFILNHAKALQLLGVWKANGGPILTNASAEAVLAIRYKFPELADAEIYHGLDRIAKTSWLMGYRPTGIYFDDSEKTVATVKEETGWTAILVR